MSLDDVEDTKDTSKTANTMTSLDPSHLPFLSDKPSHGQAVHRQSRAQDDVSDVDSQGYPTSIERLDREDRRRAKREGRQRVQRVVPAIPDLRFEQSYLLSIRPFIHPVPSKTDKHGPLTSDDPSKARHDVEGEQSKTLTTSANEDEVFHWGREVQVEWRKAAWVTFRDQVISPLFQGFMWGSLAIALSATSSVARATLYPPGHENKGRIVGGSGGTKGNGEVVGNPKKGGWWRNWVKSLGGGLETVFV